MPTIILAVVCIVLIFVLYIVSGGWKKYGGLLGIVKWIRTTSYGGKRDASTVRRAARTSASSSDEQVVEVLRQIYQEFEMKYEKLLERIERLEAKNDEVPNLDSHTDLVPEVSIKEEAHHHQHTEELGAMSRQDLYFRILDLLESGKTEQEITALLSVDRDDILYVRRIMSDPTQH